MKLSLRIWLLGILYPMVSSTFFYRDEWFFLILLVPIALFISLPTLLLFEIFLNKIISCTASIRKKWIKLAGSIVIAISVNALLIVIYLGNISEFLGQCLVFIIIAMLSGIMAALTLFNSVNRAFKTNIEAE